MNRIEPSDNTVLSSFVGFYGYYIIQLRILKTGAGKFMGHFQAFDDLL